jgi:hypothetical protein
MGKNCVRGFAALVFAAVSTCAPVLAASTSAPADEYFGRYHLSILGIRNAIAGMTNGAQQDPKSASRYLESAELTEDAIHQWQQRYPQDSWLPKTILSLETLYIAIGSDKGEKQAEATAAWLDKSFPGNAVAKAGHDELASANNSDDGGPSTADSPKVLGMVPALAGDASSSDTAKEPSEDPIPSYATRDNK